MNSDYRTTILMIVVAALAAAAAASVYPWPETVVISGAVNKPLFENYDTRAVRSIRISQYSERHNELETIVLRRKGEKWIVPAKHNFVANNGSQVGETVNLLIEKVVLDKQSDDQQDHVKYGVVDPSEFESGANRSSLGKKIVLEDRNKKELASLIVGSPLKNDPKGLKHYVRVPGQPSIYVIEIDDRWLKTDFGDWVDPNLLSLKPKTGMHSITVDSYRIDPEKIGAKERQPFYVATASMARGQLKIGVQVADADGKIKESKVTDRQLQAIQSAARSIGVLTFSDVQPKATALVKALAKQDPNSNLADFSSAQEFGFVVTEYENGNWQFDSVGGEIVVRTNDGVVVTVLVGAIDSQSRNGSLKLNHYLMLVAGMDESLIPEPDKLDSDDEVSKDQKKAYLRLVAARGKQLQAGRQRANELNKMYAKWYYVVSEDLVAALRPDFSDGTPDQQPVSQPDQPAE